jgi:hypothetical protein
MRCRVLTDLRQRHLKCDERKPQCENCAAAGFICDGIGNARFKTLRRAVLPSPDFSKRRLRPPPTNRSSEAENRAIQFYIVHVGQNATDIVDRRFWLEFVPRLAMVEDAVFYAVLTISHLTEHPTKVTRPLKPVADAELSRVAHLPALCWYDRSLRMLRTGQPVCAPINTLACILYGRIEMLQGRGMQGLGWLQRAFFLNQGEENATHSELEVLNTTLPVLAKTMIPLSSFGFALPSHQRAQTRRKRSKSVLQDFGQESNLLDVMIDLYDLVYQAQILCAPQQGSCNHSEDRVALVDRLLEWKAVVDKNLVFYRTSATRQFLAHLFVLFHTQYIRLCSTSAEDDAAHDCFEMNFAAIVSEALIALRVGSKSANEITYDMSIVPCLYFTAWACRQRYIRTQAVQLIRESAPRCDHLWTMPGVVGTLETLIAHEDAMTSSEDISQSVQQDFNCWQTVGGVPEAIVQCQVPENIATVLRDR